MSDYIMFVLGYDLLHDYFKDSKNNECDVVYMRCLAIYHGFIESYYYKLDMSEYDALKLYVEEVVMADVDNRKFKIGDKVEYVGNMFYDVSSDLVVVDFDIDYQDNEKYKDGLVVAQEGSHGYRWSVSEDDLVKKREKIS